MPDKKKKRALIIILALLLVLVIALIAGPGMPKPILTKDLPSVMLTSPEVGKYVNDREMAIQNIRPANASQVHYANDSTREQTEYCLLYLHGFSASPQEGYPSHINIGKAFGMNTYIPRLAEHGLITNDALLNMTPDNLWNSAKEALVLAKALGKRIILMGTSTGGTLALHMAAEYPDDIAAVILYSPCVKIANKASWILARPYGVQLGRMVFGGKYRVLEKNPVTDPYWYQTYRVEGTVYLQQLVEKTMKVREFKKVTQPVFVGCYYRDQEHQDEVVSVSAIRWMFDHLGTSPEQKAFVAFPDAGAHVIACVYTNPEWMKVYTATFEFLSKTVGLPLINNQSL
ncbi:MAG: alpha/beta fold hydrolase [Bacteroidales bacterium]|nr:alpha/beta fold hydrolase [Bacteroidales bacterium]